MTRQRLTSTLMLGCAYAGRAYAGRAYTGRAYAGRAYAGRAHVVNAYARVAGWEATEGLVDWLEVAVVVKAKAQCKVRPLEDNRRDSCQPTNNLGKCPPTSRHSKVYMMVHERADDEMLLHLNLWTPHRLMPMRLTPSHPTAWAALAATSCELKRHAAGRSPPFFLQPIRWVARAHPQWLPRPPRSSPIH